MYRNSPVLRFLIKFSLFSDNLRQETLGNSKVTSIRQAFSIAPPVLSVSPLVTVSKDLKN